MACFTSTFFPNLRYEDTSYNIGRGAAISDTSSQLPGLVSNIYTTPSQFHSSTIYIDEYEVEDKAGMPIIREQLSYKELSEEQKPSLESSVKKQCISDCSIEISEQFSYIVGDIYELDIFDLKDCTKIDLIKFYEIDITLLPNNTSWCESIITATIKEYYHRIITLTLFHDAMVGIHKTSTKEHEVEFHHGFVDDEAVLTIKLNNSLFRVSKNNNITRKCRKGYITFLLSSSAIDIYISMMEFECLSFLINEYKKLTHNWTLYNNDMFTLVAPID